MSTPRLAGALLVALLAPSVAALSARAQAPAAVPEAMPFDIPYGTPIGLDTAQKAISAAINEAKKHNWKMAVAVVDPSGNLVAEATMDDTQHASIPIAQAKARTSALFRRPSKVFQDGVNSNGSPGLLSLLAMNGGVASEGGFPVVVDGKLIGAVGASGGISTQDAVTAKAGADAITSH